MLLLPVLVACAQTPGADPLSIRLDGRLAEREWTEATEHPLTNGGRLLLHQDTSYLFVAVEGVGEGWSHVYVLGRDTVHVLHASAALGTARYVRDGSPWRLVSPFVWSVRDTTISEAAEAARAAFAAREGWVANTNGMGAGHVIEFRIADDLFGSEAPRLAVLFAEDPAAPSYWPASLADATLDADLIRGTPPPHLVLVPSTWGVALRE